MLYLIFVLFVVAAAAVVLPCIALRKRRALRQEAYFARIRSVERAHLRYVLANCAARSRLRVLPAADTVTLPAERRLA